MKKCNHCNAENLDNARFCDSCGIKFEEIEPIIFEDEQNIVSEETTSVAQQDVIENETEKEPKNEEPTINEQSPVSYGPYLTTRKHGGLMAFSIINICSILFSVFTLYMSFFSMIFGIIAVATLNKAKNEPNDEYYKIKKRNALILNIVGLVLGLLGFIAFILLVVYFILTGLSGIENSIL